MKISGIVITRNEEEHIAGTIASLQQVCAEVLVVDSGSDDQTVSIAEAAGARTVVREWDGYVNQRNAAAELAAHDWVLFLDADERMSDRMATILRHLASGEGEPVAAGFAFRRNIHFMGRVFRNSPLTCEWKIRLYDRRRGRWVGGGVHESVSLDGNAVRIPAFVDHYAYHDVADVVDRFRRYAFLRAEDYFRKGRRTGWLRLGLQIKMTFLKKYLLEGKFLHGTPGLILACLETHYTALKYMRLYELQRAAEKGEPCDER